MFIVRAYETQIRFAGRMISISIINQVVRIEPQFFRGLLRYLLVLQESANRMALLTFIVCDVPINSLLHYIS